MKLILGYNEHFSYIAAIQQDVVDFGFLAARGAHAVVLIAIEEGRQLGSI